jgi:serine protease Do
MTRTQIFAALLVGALIAGLPYERPAFADSMFMQCYDEARGVLHKRRADNCSGKIVTDTEAKTIQAELRAKRLQRLKRAMKPREERNTGRRGHGTGFFITPAGHIITNNHVIEKCKGAIWVDSTDGQSSKTSVIDTDKRNDLALLKGGFPAPATAVFRSPVDIMKGEDVIVIGYGTHTLAPIKPHITKGSFDFNNRAGTRFRMQAAVRPGNSGGPVLDANGQVIGVVYAQLNSVSTFKATGKLVLDKGFGITNPLVFRLLEKHNVRYTRGAPGQSISNLPLFNAAKPFMARISCRH